MMRAETHAAATNGCLRAAGRRHAPPPRKGLDNEHYTALLCLKRRQCNTKATDERAAGEYDEALTSLQAKVSTHSQPSAARTFATAVERKNVRKENVSTKKNGLQIYATNVRPCVNTYTRAYEHQPCLVYDFPPFFHRRGAPKRRLYTPLTNGT
ncbi:unnamed protein product [Ectocarpus sp. 12 AP-2014]